MDDQCAAFINPQNQGQLTLSLASVLGLISFVLLITIIIVTIYISYRLCKHDKKLERCCFIINLLTVIIIMLYCRPPQVQIYEMVDIPSQDDSSCKPEDPLHKYRDIHWSS